MAFEHHPGLHALWLASEAQKQKEEQDPIVEQVQKEVKPRRARRARRSSKPNA